MSPAHPTVTRRVLLGAAVGSIAAASLSIIGCAQEPTLPKPAPSTPGDPSPGVQPDPSPMPPPPELLLASLARTDEVAVINPALADAEAVTRIRVGAAPWGVGATASGAVGYAATAEGLAVIDLVAGERTAVVQYAHPAATISSGEYRQGGLGLAVAPDGARVYVAVQTAQGDAVLEIFDTTSQAFIGSVPVGLRPFDVLVAPDGAWAATVDHDGFSVTVVNAETLTPITYPIAPFGTVGGLASWEKPHYGVVEASGTILLPIQGLVVTRLDPLTGQTHDLTSAANSHSHGTALAGERLLTVGTGSFGNATGEPNLSILDLSSGAEEIVALEAPHETVAAWHSADGAAYAVVAGGNTRDAGWDGVTIISLETFESRRLAVPGYPQALVSFSPAG